jgi:acyl-homoserine lactone acylase PvdQ
LVQDGSTSANDWKGLHAVKDIVHIVNPVTGWIQNCNSTPFTVSGTASPLRTKYPAYMAPDGENFRDKNAVRLFSQVKSLDVKDLIALGYDRKLTAFEVLIPALIKAYSQQDRTELKELIDLLKSWNLQADENSIAQHVAIRWGQALMPKIPKLEQFGGETDPVINFTQFAKVANPSVLLDALAQVKKDIEQQWGTWKVTWGEVNRFQRISNKQPSVFDDNLPSIAVPFTSSAWGQLPSYTSRSVNETKKWYGVNGNSFVAAVEFGPKVKAVSLLAGGQSGDPDSPHFFDQAGLYVKGEFKKVLFYKNEVLKGYKEVYQP